MTKSKITSVGLFVPQRVVSNEDLSSFLDTDNEWITKNTGIKRRYVSTKENTSDICASAGKEALINAKVDPLDVDIIIVATITPEYLMPSVSCLVQSKLGCKNAFCFDVSAACSGFVYALSVADKFIRSGVYKNALVIGGEILSKIVNWKDRNTAILFGDGAGAVFMEASEDYGYIAEDLHSDGSKGMVLTAGFMPVKNIFGNVKFKTEAIKMDGKEVFSFATKTVPVSIMKLLAKTEYTLDDIKYIVPHQANIRIIETMAKRLRIDKDRFYVNIDRYGNTSSASIPMALYEMWKNGNISFGSGEKIILTGFGGGLTWGSVLIQL